jgi:hypothetical protein
MNSRQIDILNRINEAIERGDIKAIAKETTMSREYVGRVLNPFNPIYNQQVINAALKLITDREVADRKILRKLDKVV